MCVSLLQRHTHTRIQNLWSKDSVTRSTQQTTIGFVLRLCSFSTIFLCNVGQDGSSSKWSLFNSVSSFSSFRFKNCTGPINNMKQRLGSEEPQTNSRMLNVYLLWAFNCALQRGALCVFCFFFTPSQATFRGCVFPYFLPHSLNFLRLCVFSISWRSKSWRCVRAPIFSRASSSFSKHSSGQSNPESPMEVFFFFFCRSWKHLKDGILFLFPFSSKALNSQISLVQVSFSRCYDCC